MLSKRTILLLILILILNSIKFLSCTPIDFFIGKTFYYTNHKDYVIDFSFFNKQVIFTFSHFGGPPTKMYFDYTYENDILKLKLKYIDEFFNSKYFLRNYNVPKDISSIKINKLNSNTFLFDCSEDEYFKSYISLLIGFFKDQKIFSDDNNFNLQLSQYKFLLNIFTEGQDKNILGQTFDQLVD